MKKLVSILSIAFLLINLANSQYTVTITGTTPICYNTSPGDLTVSTNPGGATITAYQWSASDNGSSNFIVVGTEATYNPGELINKKYFKCRVTIAGTGYNSNTLGIIVKPVFSGGYIAGSQALCYDASADTLEFDTITKGNVGTTLYQWLESPDSIVWSNISDADTSIYIPGKLKATKYIKCKVSNLCGTDTTNALKLSVSPILTSGIISGDQTKCYLSKMDTIKGIESPTGGTLPYTYLWQSSTDSSVWADVSATATNNFLVPSKIVGKTFYRRIVYDNGCDTLPANTITILVKEKLQDPQTNISKAYCLNDLVNLIISNPLSTNNWYDKDMNLLTNAKSYIIESITNDKLLFVKSINSDGCASDSIRLNLVVSTLSANFTVDNNHIKAWKPIQFTSTSTNATRFLWSFGDESTDTLENPKHVYQKGGNYTVTLYIGDENNCEDSYTLSSTIQIDPSAMRNHNSMDVSIFPVPATDKLTVSLPDNEKYELKIFDLTGQLISESKLVEIVNSIDISGISSGNYMILVIGENGNSYSQTIVIK